ncbi:efflux RND transporter periplasmic adaptor subunit [Microbacteriaceae bacterium K1510]|nr:efflux RND transporter periplasmic adaptor subunit [Microbacteriaceae bacterium K1510]
MKASRVTAVGLVAAAALWIASGHLMSNHAGEGQAAIRAGEAKSQPLFRVEVEPAKVVPHSPTLTLSGRTEADRRVAVAARTGGVLTELRVKRGQHVDKDEIIAVLSDEAREAQVTQAEALVDQRKAELDAKRSLIASGALPKLDLVNLEAQHKAAQAALAMARAERDRGLVRAPWAGVITETPSEVGGAAFSMAGKEIATMVALDPMLAVVEVSERKLAGIKVDETAEVRLINGQNVSGRVRYVAKSASQTTRTYRVEVVMANADGQIPDGITAEVSLSLKPAPAVRMPRSALTISSAGDIGVRVVGEGDKVAFVPVRIIEDMQDTMWLSGIADGARVIVRGQDFVREGQKVAVVEAQTESAAR